MSLRVPRLVLALGLAVGLGAPLAAVAAGLHHHGGHGRPQTAAEAREQAGRMTDRMLDRVDATDAQRDQIDAVLDRDVPKAFALHAKADAVRKDLREALSADKIDRNELEDIRQDGLAVADEGSKIMLNTIADIATVLTVDQRREVADMWDMFHPGPPGGPEGGPDGGPGFGGRGGPAGGPGMGGDGMGGGGMGGAGAPQDGRPE